MKKYTKSFSRITRPKGAKKQDFGSKKILKGHFLKLSNFVMTKKWLKN